MKLIFEVKSVRHDKNGAEVLLEEPKDTNQGSVYELQQLSVFPDDETEIGKWVSRIGRKVSLVVEDL